MLLILSFFEETEEFREMFTIEIVFTSNPSRVSVIIVSKKIIIVSDVHFDSPPECSIFHTLILYYML